MATPEGFRGREWSEAVGIFAVIFRLAKLVYRYTDYARLNKKRKEGHYGPVSLHWLIPEIPSYKTLQYMRIGLKHNTPNKD